MSEQNTLNTVLDALRDLGIIVPDLIKIEGAIPNESVAVWSSKNGMCSVSVLDATAAGRLTFTPDSRKDDTLSIASVIVSTPLFGNANAVAKDIINKAFVAAGSRFVTIVRKEDPAYLDVCFRAGANHIANSIKKTGVQAEDLADAVASMLSAAAAPKVARIRAALDPTFCQAADILSKSPESDINEGVVSFYMALDVPKGERQEAAEKRLRTASPFMNLAGYLALVPRIADAVDANEKLFRVVEEATGGAITKPIMTRLGQAGDPRARRAVAAGMLKGLPPDQYPRSDSQWKHALDLWDAAADLADALNVHVSQVWKPSRIVQAKGDWEGLAKNVLSKSIDPRPPHDLGISKEDAEEVRNAIEPKPFSRGDDPNTELSKYLSKASLRLKAISEREGRETLNDFSKEAFCSWMLRLCHREVSRESLFSALRGVEEGASLFGQRVLLPNVLNAERLPGLPIIPSVLVGAKMSAFEVLIGESNFTQMATFSRTFTARQAILSAPIISARERVTNQEPEKPKAPTLDTLEDSVWRKVFKISEDKPDWPALTKIMEFEPGLVFVPIDNLLQAQEEGSMAARKDRCGVPEMNVCLGSNHAPPAITASGAYQLFSIRRVEGGTYRRIATGTFSLVVNKDTGGVEILQPRYGSTFTGPSNTYPSEEAIRIFSKFTAYVEQNPAALNPAVIETVRNLGGMIVDPYGIHRGNRLFAAPDDNRLQLQNAQARAEQRELINRDITLPRVIGYNPFEVYKVETVWENWRDQGLVAPSYLDKSLKERAYLPELSPLHDTIKGVLTRVGVENVARPVDQETHIRKPIPAVKTGRSVGSVFG